MTDDRAPAGICRHPIILLVAIRIAVTPAFVLGKKLRLFFYLFLSDFRLAGVLSDVDKALNVTFRDEIPLLCQS